MATWEEDRSANWFHGKLDRDLAEITLKKSGSKECFLVRESTTEPGEFVLSVLSAGNVHHIQIMRHEKDAFFSIDTEHKNVIHGLDELIKEYLREGELVVGTERIPLNKPLSGHPPPSDCMIHGRENLLHRAASAAAPEHLLESANVVEAMVQAKHRNLEAKNAEGQTAVHIAAAWGNNYVLKILIRAKCNVNAKDSQSCTPLHYACMNNHPDTVRILMDQGGALPWIRRCGDRVPLHDAAAGGHLECVKILLSEYQVALRPLTNDEKMPLDLAAEGNHHSTVEFLQSYRPPVCQNGESTWYHPHVLRQEAVRLLEHKSQEYEEECRKSIGFYLIRRSENQGGKDVLTLLYLYNKPVITNYTILRTRNYFHFKNGPYFESREELVDHYSRWEDGLPTTLGVGVSPVGPPPLPDRVPRTSPNNGFNNPFNNNNRPPFSRDGIPSDWIVLGNTLGEGEFGMVNEGELRVPNKPVLRVAVKRLNRELHEFARNEFIQEAKLMLNLHHDHVVKLIGFCWENETYMVQELMSLGSLRDYLVNHEEEISPQTDIRLWAHQISKGMCYLQDQHLVHRDLAARNILLARKDLAKISDFGLSRHLGLDHDYYTATRGGRWPVKWYAPECCTRAMFTHASDVWSFGVTLWEMYSYGETPFPDLDGSRVIEEVLRGERLGRPLSCSEEDYEVMLKCWQECASDRITFHELVLYFGSSPV